MDPYLNIKPTASPTLFYNETRHGGGFWADPGVPFLAVPLVLFLVSTCVLCNFIKLKYCPNTCWVSRHPTEDANMIIRRTPVRVQPTPTLQQLTREVDVLTRVLFELVQNQNGIQNENEIQDELEKNNEEDIENNNDQNNNDETKTETSEESTEEWKSIEV